MITIAAFWCMQLDLNPLLMMDEITSYKNEILLLLYYYTNYHTLADADAEMLCCKLFFY